MRRIMRSTDAVRQVIGSVLLVTLVLGGLGCEPQEHRPAKGWVSSGEMYERATTFEALGLTSMANTWYRKAAEADHPIAQVAMGFLYRYGTAGFLQDPYEARRWYLRIARERVPMALADFNGRNMPHRPEAHQRAQEEAEQWFRRGAAACHAAALQGDLQAQTLLGGLYGAGAGVEQSRAQALYWWHHAAQQGYGPAQLILGRLHRHEQSYEEARLWLRTAAEQGLGEAEYLLSELYQFGRSVPPDNQEALQWLRRSAEHGYPFAQRQLRGMAVQGLLD